MSVKSSGRRRDRPSAKAATNSHTVRQKSIAEQLAAVRGMLDRMEQTLQEIVRCDPGKFGGHSELRAAHETLKRSLDESRARLARPTFRIGTFATTSAGKSTLVNAIIGRRLAPLSAQEMSAGLLKLVHRPNGLTVSIEATDGATWPTGVWPTNPDTVVTDDKVYNLIRDDIMTGYHVKKKLSSIAMPIITVETQLLPGRAPHLFGLPAGIGFEILDLPGLNSTDGDDSNLRVIQEQIAGAFCVMVLDYNQTDERRRHMLLDEMAEVVRTMGGRDDSLMFLLNKFNQRDRADSDAEVKERIQSLQSEIKERLGLQKPPDVMPVDARSWMYAQCAWGASAPSDGPSAPDEVREQCLRDFRHDCTTEVERLSEKYPEIDQWWERHRRSLHELPPTELGVLLTDIVRRHTGAADVLGLIGKRLQERFASLIIWPAVQGFSADCEKFLATVTVLARKGQRSTGESIESAIKETKLTAKALRQSLAKEGATFREQITQVKKALQGIKRIKSAILAAEHSKMITEHRQKHQNFFVPLETFTRQAHDDLLSTLSEPLLQAAAADNGAKELERRLANAIPEHLAAQIASAYRRYSAAIAGFDDDDAYVTRRVKKTNDRGVAEIREAKSAFKDLVSILSEAIERRASFFVQGRARDLETVLYNEIQALHRRLKDEALAHADEPDEIEAVFEEDGVRGLAEQLSLPPNLFDLAADIVENNESELEVEMKTRAVNKRTWRRLWLWKSEVVEEYADYVEVDYVTLTLDAPAVLAEKVGEASENALDHLTDALLKWMSLAFERYTKDLEGSIAKLGDVVEAELNRMLGLNVGELEKEVEKWKLIGERASEAAPLRGQIKALVLGTEQRA